MGDRVHALAKARIIRPGRLLSHARSLGAEGTEDPGLLTLHALRALQRPTTSFTMLLLPLLIRGPVRGHAAAAHGFIYPRSLIPNAPRR